MILSFWVIRRKNEINMYKIKCQLNVITSTYPNFYAVTDKGLYVDNGELDFLIQLCYPI